MSWALKLDKLPHKRRKLTEPVPEEELPAEFSPLQPLSIIKIAMVATVR